MRTSHRVGLHKVCLVSLLSLIAATGARADARSDVAALDRQFQSAVKHNDAKTIDRIVADDYVLVEGDGTVSHKADLLRDARSHRYTYVHQEELTQTVRLWGDTAIVTAELWGQGTEKGEPFNWKVWFSDTYIRTATGWHYVFGQASLPLPETEKTAH